MAFWLRLAHYFKHSIFGKAVMSIGRFFSNGWGASRTNAWLQRENVFERGFSQKRLSRFSEFPWIKKSSSITSKSRIIGKLADFCDALPYVSFRSFGVMFFLVGAIATMGTLMTNGWLVPFYVALAVFGLLLMLLNRSFAELFHGSHVMQKTLGFFMVTPNLLKDKGRYCLPIFVVFGVVFGIAAHFGGIMGFVMASGGVFGTLLVFHRVEIGVFAAALFMPILPTMLIMGIVVISTLSFILKCTISGKATIKFGYIDLFVAIFAAIVAYGLLITYNPSSSLPVAGVYLLFIGFYFVVKNTINTREKLLSTVAIAMFSGFLVALFGIYQRLTGNFGMTAAWLDAGMFGAVDRIYSTLENPNVLGGYLIFIVIIAFAMIYYYKDAWHKLFALGIFATAGLCIVFTHSRGAWLGLIIAFAVFALIRERRLIFLGIIGLIAAPFIIPPEILTRFLSIGDMADTSTSYRVSIWLGSVDMLRVFWPSGIGQGVENFNFIYNLFALSAAFTQHTHMLYLQIMVYWGIVGIGMFLLITCGFFKNLVHAVRSADNTTKTLGAAFFAALAGFLVKGFTDNVWYNFRIFAFFWLMAGLIISLANISKQEGSVENGK